MSKNSGNDRFFNKLKNSLEGALLHKQGKIHLHTDTFTLSEAPSGLPPGQTQDNTEADEWLNARLGVPRSLNKKKTPKGAARHGKAGRGMARRGKARHGLAWHG